MTMKTKTIGAPVRVETRSTASQVPGNQAAHADPRWPQIAAALAALRERGRHAVRMVDADCACGTLLIEAARHAHALGFTGIEARGIDGSLALIGRARAAAGRLHDPAIGLTFELADMVQALAEEADFPADIVLWHGDRPDDHRVGVREALASAGDLVISDANGGEIEKVAA